MNLTEEPFSSGEGPQSSTATSRSLLERIKADDAAAWDRLIDLYAPLVFQWCRRWDLPEQDLADVFQDIFQAVSSHIASFRKDREGDTFRGWLRTIAKNKVHDHYRKLGGQPRGAGGTDAQIRLARLPAARAHGDDEDDSDSAAHDAERGLFGRALELIRGEFEDRTWQAFCRT